MAAAMCKSSALNGGFSIPSITTGAHLNSGLTIGMKSVQVSVQGIVVSNHGGRGYGNEVMYSDEDLTLEGDKTQRLGRIS
jgi:hypothetical protein